MKIQVISLVLLCAAQSLFCQVQFGAKAYLSTSLTQASTKDYVDVGAKMRYQISYDKSEPRKGFGLTLFAQNKLLFFASDALYNESGHHFTLLSTNLRRTNLDPAIHMKTSSKNLRLVVNSGVKLGKLKLGVGPEIAMTLNSEEELSQVNGVSHKQSHYKSGFNFLVGYIMNKHLHIDLRHTYIFQDVSSAYTFQGIPMDMRKNPKYFEIIIAAYL